MTPSVLLVDDDPRARRLVRAMLTGVDVTIVEAGDGPTALRLAEEGDFCCVLLDVAMPEMDGFEVAAALRNQDGGADLPILFATAHATDETDAFEGYERGAADYLVKPFPRFALVAKVQVFARIWTQRRELERVNRALSVSNAELDRLATVASEQARTPLPVVSAYARLLEERYGEDLDPEVRASARRLEAQARDMEGALLGALRLARVVTQGGPLVEQDLCAIVSLAADDVDPDPTWLHRATPDSMPVLGEARQLRRLVRALLRRARGPAEAPASLTVREEQGWQLDFGPPGVVMSSPAPAPEGTTEDALRTLELARIAERHGGALLLDASDPSASRLTLPKG